MIFLVIIYRVAFKYLTHFSNIVSQKGRAISKGFDIALKTPNLSLLALATKFGLTPIAMLKSKIQSF